MQVNLLVTQNLNYYSNLRQKKLIFSVNSHLIIISELLIENSKDVFDKILLKIKNLLFQL